jgi:hypothetical protein
VKGLLCLLTVHRAAGGEISEDFEELSLKLPTTEQKTGIYHDAHILEMFYAHVISEQKYKLITTPGERISITEASILYSSRAALFCSLSSDQKDVSMYWVTAMQIAVQQGDNACIQKTNPGGFHRRRLPRPAGRLVRRPKAWIGLLFRLRSRIGKGQGRKHSKLATGCCLN